MNQTDEADVERADFGKNSIRADSGQRQQLLDRREGEYQMRAGVERIGGWSKLVIVLIGANQIEGSDYFVEVPIVGQSNDGRSQKLPRNDENRYKHGEPLDAIPFYGHPSR